MGTLTLTPKRLIQKIQEATGMKNSNGNWTPTDQAALGIDPNRLPMQDLGVIDQSSVCSYIYPPTHVQTLPLPSLAEFRCGVTPGHHWYWSTPTEYIFLVMLAPVQIAGAYCWLVVMNHLLSDASTSTSTSTMHHATTHHDFYTVPPFADGADANQPRAAKSSILLD